MPCPVCAWGKADALCPYHGSGVHASWAEGNRIVCDLLHRGVEPPRLSVEERDESWAPVLVGSYAHARRR